MLQLKFVSSLEKIFVDGKLTDYPETSRLSALRGEHVSFQLAFTAYGLMPAHWEPKIKCKLLLEGDLADKVRVRKVKSVPVEFPVYPTRCDDNYLRKTPGLYPDALFPMTYVLPESPYGMEWAVEGLLRSLWFDFVVPEDMKAGKHKLKLKLVGEGGKESAEAEFTLEVIPATLPKQTLIYTEWFHCDGLAAKYDVPVWSDEHFAILRRFMRAAHENGINMILVPVFTPPLDTRVGGERLTTQLVRVTKVGDGFTFNFDLLDKFLNMAREIGFEYYEIAHLFTQWGVYHAPKIIVNVNGEDVKYFGWETDSHGPEYTAFLRSFLPALLTHMKERGEDKKCFFHISDEPGGDHLESYKKAKEAVIDLLAGYPVMDALSNFEFWKQGIVQLPIPANNHIEPFLKAKVPGLWTYYCCSQAVGVSNRLIAMPSWRNRTIGLQMYKYDIKGFLQWGLNFYNNQFSVDDVNPWVDNSGEYWVPAGDTCCLYPDFGGKPIESLRLVVFNEGISDMRALQLCETLYGKDRVVKEMEKAFGSEIVFNDCAHTAAQILAVREKINAMIKRKVKNA